MVDQFVWGQRGLRARPGAASTLPRGQDWKQGVLDALGWAHDDHADVARGWQRVFAADGKYADLEPDLLARVEELIDFVTATPARPLTPRPPHPTPPSPAQPAVWGRGRGRRGAGAGTGPTCDRRVVRLRSGSHSS